MGYIYHDSDCERVKDFLIVNCIATEAEISLVVDINGYSEETMNDILYARTGYRDIEQVE